jgi:hypothetical protein
MRALALGLGAAPSEAPPPLYSFDRGTGRLAITTPRYSTAIVPDNRGAFDYGGIELARLFGPGQRVAATTGGRPPSAFGVVLRDRAGRALLASQGGRRRARIRLLDRSAPFGAFRRLRATGAVERGGLRIATTHAFEPSAIAVAWRIRCGRGCAGAEVQLPTWDEDAAIAVDGAPLTSAVPLAAGARLQLGARYAATVEAAPPGATIEPVATAPQRTAPHPGPTAVIRLPAGATRVAVRLSP